MSSTTPEPAPVWPAASPDDPALLAALARLPAEAVAAMRAADSPAALQALLDRTPYSADPIYRCPRSALRDGRAHCFDGAVLAALALWMHGDPPRIVDMRADNDDDHVLAVYQRDGCWGAVAKSNTTVLRSREPVYRDLRELVMSYFDFYYNLDRAKALRSFSAPVDLRDFLALDWPCDDDAMEAIAAHLDAIPHTELLSPAQIARLSPVDQAVYDAGLLGANPAGLYQPKPESAAATASDATTA